MTNISRNTQPNDKGTVVAPDTQPNDKGTVVAPDTQPNDKGTVVAPDTQPNDKGTVVAPDTQPNDKGTVVAPDTQPNDKGTVVAPDTKPNDKGTVVALDTQQNDKGTVVALDTQPNDKGTVVAPDTKPNDKWRAPDVGPNVNEGDLYLHGGRFQHEGLLLMYGRGVWRTVCPLGQNLWEQLACAQLGYKDTTGVLSYTRSVVWNSFSMRIHKCDRNAQRLSDCSYNTTSGCSTLKSIGVQILHCKRNTLPSYRDSVTLSTYVVLPLEHLTYNQYLDYYDGYYTVQVPKRSVLLKVWQFNLRKIHHDNRCEENVNSNYLALVGERSGSVDEDGNTTVLCGFGNTPVLIFRGSVQFHIHLRIAERDPYFVFNAMFVVLPSSQEPKQLSWDSKMYNCSVPYSNRFITLFSCDWVQDCEDGIDESGCALYDYKICGSFGQFFGGKCYKAFRATSNMTWYHAHQQCVARGYRLAQLTDREAFKELSRGAYKADVHRVFLGMKGGLITANLPVAYLYRQMWRSSEGRTLFSIKYDFQMAQTIATLCVIATHYLEDWNPDLWDITEYYLYTHECTDTFQMHSHHFQEVLLCEYDKPVEKRNSNSDLPAGVTISTIVFRPSAYAGLRLKTCPLGHVTRDFLSCDAESKCGAQTVVTSCQVSTKSVSTFVCDYGGQTVPYTLLCDHISHCTDGSDESFCQFQPCPPSMFKCSSGQCVNMSALCDEKLDCYDQTDEMVCILDKYTRKLFKFVPPSVISLNGEGTFTWNSSISCPESHFMCPDGFCLPVYLRCNGVWDCSGREDEMNCESYTCPGFYRCRASHVCLHPQHVCDGVFHCPEYDDELLCDLSCPDQCHCHGLSFVCSNVFQAVSFPRLRYVDVSGTTAREHHFVHNMYLIYLRLSNTGMNTAPVLSLPNLRVLDISHNAITFVNMQSFGYLKNLRKLSLKGNPLLEITYSVFSDVASSFLNMDFRDKGGTLSAQLSPLQEIDLSHTRLTVYNGSVFINFPKLSFVNISASSVHTITEEGFQASPALAVLDVTTSPLKLFPHDVFQNLSELRSVHADLFKLCCQDVLPVGFDVSKCYSKQDALSTCEDLLGSNTYRVFLWAFSSLSVFGNTVSFVVNGARGGLGVKQASNFVILLTNLNVADFVTGVYLGVVGVSDAVHRGQYLWEDTDWKESTACSIAGLLYVTSRLVSSFLVFLITLDRFLVLRYQFTKFHITTRSCVAVCVVAWTVGVVLAGVPLTPSASHWDFYSQTGICIPLPLSGAVEFTGQSFLLGLLIVNLVLFTLAAIAWIIILVTDYGSSDAADKPLFEDPRSRAEDIDVTKRARFIVATDFLCLVPVGLLSVLACSGTDVSGQVWVGVALLLLPVNSALNPALYAVSVVMERRRKRQMENLLKRLKAVNRAGRVGGNNAGPVQRGNTSRHAGTRPEEVAHRAEQRNDKTGQDGGHVAEHAAHVAKGQNASTTVAADPKLSSEHIQDDEVILINGEHDKTTVRSSNGNTAVEQVVCWLQGNVVGAEDVLNTLAQDEDRRRIIKDWLARKMCD